MRRARRWYVEYEGLLSTTYESAAAAARGLAHRQSGLAVPVLPPPDIASWHRGDLS